MIGFNLARDIMKIVNRTDRQGRFRATVTGTSGNLVFIRRTGQLVADVQAYPRLVSYTSPAADDEVIVERLGGGFIVMGEVSR